MMICPICMKDSFTQPLGTTHYVCVKDPDLDEEEDNGCGSQFELKRDNRIRYPYNLIYMDRGSDEFFRKPLLDTSSFKAYGSSNQ